MTLLRAGDRELSFDTVGDGQPLVLLHAFPFDRRMWWGLAPALAARFHVITLDARGFGDAPDSGPFAIADLADDIAALLDVLGLSRAAVAGLSMGGYVALAFAARHGARLEALVLADTKAGPDTPDARRGRDESIALVEAEGVEALVDRQLARLLSPSASEPLRAEVRALARQTPGAVANALLAMRDRPDRRPELAQIACPTLVLVGSEDALTPPSEAEAMAAAIPKARLAMIPGAGHLSSLEAPGPFVAALSDGAF